MSCHRPHLQFDNTELPEEFLEELAKRTLDWQEARQSWNGEDLAGEKRINEAALKIAEWLDQLPALLDANDAWEGADGRSRTANMEYLTARRALSHADVAVGRMKMVLRALAPYLHGVPGDLAAEVATLSASHA